MELKNSMSEMRNVKQSIWSSRASGTQTELEENGKKKPKPKMSKESLCDLWDVIKRTSIRIIGIPEEEKG